MELNTKIGGNCFKNIKTPVGNVLFIWPEVVHNCTKRDGDNHVFTTSRYGTDSNIYNL